MQAVLTSVTPRLVATAWPHSRGASAGPTFSCNTVELGRARQPGMHLENDDDHVLNSMHKRFQFMTRTRGFNSAFG